MAADPPGSFPLSFEQAATLAQTADSTTDTQRTAVFRVSSFDRAMLASALQAWLARHDALRMRLVNGEAGPRQRFLAPGEVKLRPRLFALPGDVDREADVGVGVSMKLVGEPLDLEDEGPLRVVVAGQPDGPAYVGVAIHHVALDALSFGAAMAEIESLLAGGSSAGVVSDEPPPSYADYVEATVGRTRPARVASNTQWWVAGAERVTFESFHVPALASASDLGPMCQDDLRLPGTELFRSAARLLGETPAALLLGVTAGAIASLTQSTTPVLVSTPATPGRALASPRLIGNLTLPLPLVVDVGGDPREDARSAGDALTQGMLRWSYSFGTWRDALRARLAALDTPPLTVVFVHRRVDEQASSTSTDGSERVAVRSNRLLPSNHIEVWFEEGLETFVAFLRYSISWLPPELAGGLRDDITRRVEHLVATAE